MGKKDLSVFIVLKSGGVAEFLYFLVVSWLFFPIATYPGCVFEKCSLQLVGGIYVLYMYSLSP